MTPQSKTLSSDGNRDAVTRCAMIPAVCAQCGMIV